MIVKDFNFGVDIGQKHFTKPGGDSLLSIKTFKTYCCSLLQMSLNNNISIGFIKEALEYLKNQRGFTLTRESGERAVFVIVCIPGEEELVEKLKEIGFKYIYEFHRRACYEDEKTMLQMWIYSW